MSRRRNLLAGLVAVAALAYLVAMTVTGAMPVQRQLVRTEAKGVLTLTPEQVRRVELARGDQRLRLIRTADVAWSRADGTALEPAAAKRLDTALLMLHRSAPVREIAAAELQGLDAARFGLDPPRLIAALYGDRDAPILTARFGAQNPEDFLQYMRLDGDGRLYLMSRFIGEEWSAALAAAAPR